MRNKIYIDSPADRDAVAAALIRAGYAVRQGREKNGNRSKSFVEYWRES